MPNDAHKPPPPPPPVRANLPKAPPPVAPKIARPLAPPPVAPPPKAAPPPMAAPVAAAPAPDAAPLDDVNPFEAVVSAGTAQAPRAEEAPLFDFDTDEPLGGVGPLDDFGANDHYGAAGLGGLGSLDEPFSESIPLPSEDSRVTSMGKRGTPKGKLIIAAIVLLGASVAGGGYYLSQRASAEAARLDEIAKIADQGEMLAALRGALGEVHDQDVKRRIIMNIGHFRDAQAVPMLIAGLDQAGVIRRDSAWALARIGLPAAAPAKEALLTVLPDTDARDHAQVVWTLAVLREQDAASAILEAFSAGKLQALDGFSANVITDVLGVQRLSSEELINHPEAAVRILTAHALAELSSAEAIEPLRAMISAELARPEDQRSAEVIRSASAGLGRSGDPRAGEPLFAVLKSNAIPRRVILEGLATSTAAPDLVVLIGAAQDAEIRLELVKLLGASHDPRSADALAGLLGDPSEPIQHEAAFALADLGDPRAQPVLLKLARADELSVARRAVAGLRATATLELAPALITLAAERPEMRADIVRAIGATKNPSAAAFLKKELEGLDKRAAALAVADLDYDPLYRTLLGLVRRPSHVNMGATSANERSLRNEDLLTERRAAILAVGRFGRPAALESLMAVVEDGSDDYELRGLAAAALGQIADTETMRTVLQKIRGNAISSAAKRYYVQALWQRPHPALNAQLLDLIQSDAPGDLRRAAALAVGYSADPANDERLRQMLSSDNARRPAAFAIALGGGEQAMNELLAILRNDADLREVLRTAVTGDDRSWFDLLSEDMFETGAVWRRLRAADHLRRGLGDTTYSYFWQHMITLLQNGSDTNRGATPRFVREQLWNALAGTEREQLWSASTGEPDLLRLLAAEALFDMRERGLLLRARDEGGPAGSAARAVIQKHEKSDEQPVAAES